MPALPEPRPVLWPLRPVGSADVTIGRDGAATAITIRHAPLRGITPEMLSWWYRHVPGTMTYAGQEWPRYLVWHPLDHIGYDVIGGSPDTVATGTRLHITEALQRNPENLLDIRVVVQQMIEGLAVIGREVLGTSVIRLTNEFSATPHGADYVTTMQIGDNTPLGRLALNPIARNRAFPESRIQPWIRHHVEEIGNLENFLPELFSSRSGVEA